MKGFRAAFYKDMKLLWRGSGLAVLLLPLLLSAAFSLFAADLSDQTGIRPFMIAVRDRDQTLMSGSLISQMRELELFSEVRKVGEDVTDEALLAEGAAAVITIPKDYFYEMYTASDCPVDVTLNESMPLESSVLQSVFVSVMKIISSDQAAQRGAYRFAYGDLDRQLLDRLYEDTSLDLFQDALSRQAVFENTLQASDAAGAMARRLLASVISMLLFILLTGALVTIPEELALGVLPRYRGAGGRIFAFILSRLVCIFLLFNLCLLMTGLGLAGILLLTGHSGDFLSGLVLLTGKASFLSACRQIWLCVLLLAVCLAACLLLVTMLAGTAERARKACNVLLLISLVLGGTLWPCSLLPSPFHLAGRLTMPWYMLLLLEETAAGSSLSAVLPDLLPVLAAGTVCLLLSILYITSSGRIRSNRQQALALANRQAVPVRQTSVFSPPPEEPGRLQSLAGRLAGLTGFKCRIAGGRAMLPLLLLLTVCSLAAGAASGQDSRALRVAVSDLDNSDISAGLTDMIREESRISLSRCSPEEGQRLLMTGSIEGLLVIDEGYGDRMRAYAETDMDQEGSGRAMPLHYYAASSAASAQGVREIAAGQVCAQRSAWRAMRIAGNLRGDPLNEAERQTLLAMIEEEKALLPALYQLHYGSGRPAGIPFLPGAEAFAAMAALMLLMTAGSFYGRRDAISASIRMQPLPGGRLLSHGSDLLSLTLTGFIYCMAALMPGLLLQAVTSGAPPVSFAAALPGRAAACFLYAFCGGALSLFLVRKSPMEGRIDAMAPVLTVLLCLTGGCFMDLTSLSRGLRFLSLLSPPGLLTGACSGSPAAFAILAAEGLLLSLLSGRSVRTGSL